MSKATENQVHLIGGSWSDSGEDDNEKSQTSHICLRVDLELDEWTKDSRFSKHITGNRKLFSTYKAYNGGNVIFGSNLRGNIIRKGNSEWKLKEEELSTGKGWYCSNTFTRLLLTEIQAVEKEILAGFADEVIFLSLLNNQRTGTYFHEDSEQMMK
ncbi:hypothetical protein Tco_1062083 [Tanacetum coccineum]